MRQVIPGWGLNKLEFGSKILLVVRIIPDIQVFTLILKTHCNISIHRLLLNVDIQLWCWTSKSGFERHPKTDFSHLSVQIWFWLTFYSLLQVKILLYYNLWWYVSFIVLSAVSAPWMQFAAAYPVIFLALTNVLVLFTFTSKEKLNLVHPFWNEALHAS